MSLFIFSILLMAPSGEDGRGGSIIGTIIILGIFGGIMYLMFRESKRNKQPKVKHVKRKTDNKDTV